MPKVIAVEFVAAKILEIIGKRTLLDSEAEEGIYRTFLLKSLATEKKCLDSKLIIKKVSETLSALIGNLSPSCAGKCFFIMR